MQEPIPNLDRDMLVKALNEAASYIRSKGANIWIVAIGSAVNTVLLQTHETTHDINFYNNFLDKQQVTLLIQASTYACKRIPGLKPSWFNNRTVFFILRTLREYLTSEAFQQNKVLFDAPGLKVFAAPWTYAIAATMDQLSNNKSQNAKPYDLSNAAEYLHHHMMLQQLNAVPQSAIEGWAQSYQTTVRLDYIQCLNEEYWRRYGRYAIAFGC